MNPVRDFIKSLTDDELKEIVEVKYADYTLEALEIAREELKNRNIEFDDQSKNAPVVSEDQLFEVGEITPVKNKNQEKKTALKCPQCNEDMDRGSIYLRATFGVFLLFGWSYKHCFFMSNNERTELKVIDNSESKPAYYCENCSYVIFKR